MKIQQVQSKRDMRLFLRFPWKVYAGDPLWVPPLLLGMKDKLNTKKHPFFQHAEAASFLAVRDGEIVGRITAIVDQNHNTAHKDKTGFFGLFECLNDVEAAKALVDTAAEWVRARGMDTLRGPMNLSMNDECAFLLEGFDSPPVVMMPYNPRYYLDLMDACGMVKAKDLVAFRLDADKTGTERVKAALARLPSASDITFRPISKKTLIADVLQVAEIYNRSWAKNWGFVPWTEDEMKHMAHDIVQFADMDLVLLAEHKGRAVGIAFGLPDLNQIIIKIRNGRLLPFGLLKLLTGRKRVNGVRALVFGVLPEYMHTGLAYLLYDKFATAIMAKGHTWCELSWELEDNQAILRFAASLGSVVYKKYRIYEKPIPVKGA
jgi:GNAT superfamily N-acetyltransferase